MADFGDANGGLHMPSEEIITLDAGAAIGIVRDQPNCYRVVLRGAGFGLAITLTTRDMAKLADAIVVISEADVQARRWAKQGG